MNHLLKTPGIRIGAIAIAIAFAIAFAAALALAGGRGASVPVVGPASAVAFCERSDEAGARPLGGSQLRSEYGFSPALLAAKPPGSNLPSAERQSRGQQASPAWRAERGGAPRVRTCGATASRIAAIRLAHLSFAADHAAARAGLLSAGGTAPPPPLG